MIPKRIHEHFVAPCTGYVGTCNAARVPHVARAHGWRVDEDGTSVHVLIPPQFAGPVEADLKENKQVAFVSGDLTNMETFQLKGELISTGAPTPQDFTAWKERSDAMVASLMKMGLPEPLLRSAFPKPSLVVRFEVQDVFVQTPGPGAGDRLQEDAQ